LLGAGDEVGPQRVAFHVADDGVKIVVRLDRKRFEAALVEVPQADFVDQLDHLVGVFADDWLLATRGKATGFRIDSTDKSMSRSGQNRWSAVWRSTTEIFSILASRNHGNCSNGKNNSSSAINSHRPCRDTFVTSTGKVLVPGIGDLLSMVFEQLLCLADNVLRQARLSGKFDFRVQPKLRLTIRMGHMDVHPRFFS
jgi:hypothetical protein